MRSGQGDSLSEKLFTLYLTGELNCLRSILKKATPPIGIDCMPLEFDYVDDWYFLADCLEDVTSILPTIQIAFKEWNLSVNPTYRSMLNISNQKQAQEEG